MPPQGMRRECVHGIDTPAFSRIIVLLDDQEEPRMPRSSALDAPIPKKPAHAKSETGIRRKVLVRLTATEHTLALRHIREGRADTLSAVLRNALMLWCEQEGLSDAERAALTQERNIHRPRRQRSNVTY